MVATSPQSCNLVVLGSLNLDLSVRVRRLPVPGETVTAGEVLRAPGGKGANQAVGARRLGARTTLLVQAGDDQVGDELVAMLEAEGVHVLAKRCRGVSTGTALIVVSEAGENTIVVSSGANGFLDDTDLDVNGSCIRSADGLLMQLEMPLETVLAAAMEAAGAGVFVVLNAAPVSETSSDLLRSLLQHVDLLVVNEGEAELLLRTLGATATGDALTNAHGLLAFGPTGVVVTVGARGAVGCDSAREFVVPAPRVEALDSVGAGDSFCAAMTVRLLEGSDFPEAMRFATFCGALATMGSGAQSAMPTRAEVDSAIMSSRTERY